MQRGTSMSLDPCPAAFIYFADTTTAAVVNFCLGIWLLRLLWDGSAREPYRPRWTETTEQTGRSDRLVASPRWPWRRRWRWSMSDGAAPAKIQEERLPRNSTHLIAVLTLAALGLTCDCKRSRTGPPERTVAGPWAFGVSPPGTSGHPADLVARLEAAWSERPKDYQPRTRHFRDDGGPKYTNRLFLETSPYLRQHAHNPVNWYPWGDEAFEAARRLGRPVLLSIGYSTCHWCHVMEEESFEDEEIARYMNEHYIAIKVDREERPDVDAVYMNAVQMLTGGGGWPMTVWLTPDRKPYYGGTYFPPRDGDRGTRLGFLSLLSRLAELYREDPERVADTAADIAKNIEENLAGSKAGGLVDAAVLHRAASFYRERADATNGGMRGAPKFPSSLPVRSLLRYHRRAGDEKSLRLAELTLDKMAAGGVYDQIGGGFHRYSTDERWLVPHFEKMLYDNALLVLAYLDGYQALGRDDFASVARHILRYVERDMTSPEGGFYSATDADSMTPEGHREEGWFFTWTPAEIEAVLGEERARTVTAYYAVTDHGNFEGRSILHTPRPLDQVATELGSAREDVLATVNESRELMVAARAKRPPPLRDEKILAAWNGLMISAHAQAALTLGEPVYAERAARAARFVLERMRSDKGRLLRSYKDGHARHNAYLDDYAALIAGLLDLYEATDDPSWLREAIALDRVLENHYEDTKGGGFFLTSDDHEKLLTREKPGYDGAEPSGNSIHALSLLRLHELTTLDAYRKRADRTVRAFGAILSRSPAALSEMLLAVDFYLDTAKEIIIVTPGSAEQAQPFLAQLRSTFLPNRVLTVVVEGQDLRARAELVPLVMDKIAQRGKATAYVCEQRACELPTNDPIVFARQVQKTRALEVEAQSE